MIGLAVVERVLKSRDVSIKLDKSRCHRSRYRKSNCIKCVDVCVNQAIKLENGTISRNSDLCKGCMLCVSSCPSNAFDWENDWHWKLISTVKSQSHSLIGCTKTMSMDNKVKVPCLGLVSEELIIALFFSVNRPVFIDSSNCNQCENSHIIPILEQRIAKVSDKLSIPIEDKISLISQKNQIKNLQCEVGRRKFLKNLKRVIVPPANRKNSSQVGEQPLCFSNKKRVTNSELLAYSLTQCDLQQREKILENYFYSIESGDQCILCGKCGAMCPTGALKLKKVNQKKQLLFHMFYCNGCNLCQEFCKQQAISVKPGAIEVPVSILRSTSSENSAQVSDKHFEI